MLSIRVLRQSHIEVVQPVVATESQNSESLARLIITGGNLLQIAYRMLFLIMY